MENPDTRVVIEHARYDEFRKLYRQGHFGQQRYGQAFHDYFKLHRMKDSFFGGLYEVKSLAEATALIEKYFRIE